MVGDIPLNMLLISSCIQFWFVNTTPKYLTLPHFQRIYQLSSFMFWICAPFLSWDMNTSVLEILTKCTAVSCPPNFEVLKYCQLSLKCLFHQQWIFRWKPLYTRRSYTATNTTENKLELRYSAFKKRYCPFPDIKISAIK